MANYVLSVDLLKIEGVTLQTNPTTGNRAIVIPIDAADIFVKEDGSAAYLSLNMYEKHNDPYGNSHSLKLKFCKATAERLGLEAIKTKPFIGNAKAKPAYGDNNTNVSAPAQPASNNWDNW